MQITAVSAINNAPSLNTTQAPTTPWSQPSTMPKELEYPTITEAWQCLSAYTCVF